MDQSNQRLPRVCGVWKKFKSVTTDRWLSHLIGHYLDANTKLHSPAAGSSLLVGQLSEQRGNGLWMFGHVAVNLCAHGVNYGTHTPTAIAPDLFRWWSKSRKGYEVKGHHFTASFSPALVSSLERAGIPTDQVMLSSVSSTLAQYARRFYPGQTIGWVAGCHHDKDHPHVHALIHPQTSGGKTLRVSGLKQGEDGVDAFDFLRDSFNSRAKEIYRIANISPTQSQDSGRDPWILLARDAYVQSQSEGATESAPEILNSSLKSKATFGALEVAHRKIRTALFVERGNPSIETPLEIESRFDGIGRRWDEMNTGHMKKARGAFSAISNSDGFRPRAQKDGLIKMPPVAEYRKNYARGEDEAFLPNPILIERRFADSRKQRADFQAALADYKRSVSEIWEQGETLLTFSAYYLTKLGVQAAAKSGKQQSFMEPITDWRTYGRSLVGADRLFDVADSEMLEAQAQDDRHGVPASEPPLPSKVTQAPSLRRILQKTDDPQMAFFGR